MASLASHVSDTGDNTFADVLPKCYPLLTPGGPGIAVPLGSQTAWHPLGRVLFSRSRFLSLHRRRGRGRDRRSRGAGGGAACFFLFSLCLLSGPFPCSLAGAMGGFALRGRGGLFARGGTSCATRPMRQTRTTSGVGSCRQLGRDFV